MSAAPGKWERLILDTLKREPVFYPVDLIRPAPTHSEYHALLRAVRQLELSGKIAVTRWMCWAGDGVEPGGKVVVHRITSPLSVTKIPRLDGDKVSAWNLVNTYQQVQP